MTSSIRHLRGSSAEWQANNPVIPDGELAIERTPNGGTKVKIGNGSTPYSSLPSLLGDSESTSGDSVTLKNGYRLRCGRRYYLTVCVPEKADDDFYCEISFDSPADATDFYVTGAHIRLSGDETADEELMPDPSKHYTIFIWYDGEYQGVVRGLPNAT